jgi:hypothetical protein
MNEQNLVLNDRSLECLDDEFLLNLNSIMSEICRFCILRAAECYLRIHRYISTVQVTCGALG